MKRMRRRDLLRISALGALAALLPAWAVRAAPPADRARGAALPAIRRYGRHYLVDGWVLTARDLQALRLHGAATAQGLDAGTRRRHDA